MVCTKSKSLQADCDLLFMFANNRDCGKLFKVKQKQLK